jgi:hypothetical protein
LAAAFFFFFFGYAPDAATRRTEHAARTRYAHPPPSPPHRTFRAAAAREDANSPGILSTWAYAATTRYRHQTTAARADDAGRRVQAGVCARVLQSARPRRQRKARLNSATTRRATPSSHVHTRTPSALYAARADSFPRTAYAVLHEVHGVHNTRWTRSPTSLYHPTRRYHHHHLHQLHDPSEQCLKNTRAITVCVRVYMYVREKRVVGQTENKKWKFFTWGTVFGWIVKTARGGKKMRIVSGLQFGAHPIALLIRSGRNTRRRRRGKIWTRFSPRLLCTRISHCCRSFRTDDCDLSVFPNNVRRVR